MNFENLSDNELLSIYLNGESKAFDFLIKKYYSRIISKINSLNNNKSITDDIFQEIIIKVLGLIKEEKYVEKGLFLHWLLKVTKNATIDYLKSHYYNTEKNYDFKSNIFQEIDQFNEDDFKNIDVYQAVLHLPDVQKEIILMRHYSNMSFKEISKKQNIKINTALARMRYALINLRKILDKNKSYLQLAS